MSDIAELKKRLLSNPIYALSLGSRELFHSNFLGWLFTNYPQMIAAIYTGPILGEVKVERERLNFDLIVTFGEPNDRQGIIVEVKVKDAPRLSQLSEYDEKIRKAKLDEKKLHKILLSLVKAPESLQDLPEWYCLNFSSIGQKIRTLVSTCKINDGHRFIIESYAQLCCDLDQLVAYATETDREARNFFLIRQGKKAQVEEINELADELRFSDTLEKQRASALSDAIRNRVESEKIESCTIEFKTDYGFDRKNAHAGAALVHKELKLRMGIHIQGNQYRRMLSLSHFVVPKQKVGKNPEALRLFIEATDGWNWMFGSSHSGGYFHKINFQEGYFRGLPLIPTNQQKGKLLCSYAPEHIYQYTNIGEKGGVPIDEVVDAVIEDIKYANELLKSKEYVDRFKNWTPKQ